MRAFILSEIDGQLKKVIWLEDRIGGVYIGFSGGSSGIHFSYHQDGTVHLKKGSEYLPMYKTTPIKDVKTFVNLGSHGITLESGYEFAVSDYRKIKDADAVVYVNPNIIRRQRILNIHSYIVYKGREEECLRSLQTSCRSFDEKSGQGFEILSANFFKMGEFKNHLIAVMLCGGAWATATG